LDKQEIRVVSENVDKLIEKIFLLSEKSLLMIKL